MDPDTWRYRLLYPVELNVTYVNLLNKVLTGGRLVRLPNNGIAGVTSEIVYAIQLNLFISE